LLDSVHKKSSLHKGYIYLFEAYQFFNQGNKAIFDNHFLHVTFAGMLGKTSKNAYP